MQKIKRAAVLCSAALCLCWPLYGCTTTTVSASTMTIEKQVTKGDLIVGLTADGTVALPVTNLNFEVEGTVSKLYFAVGDSVKQGDLLAELDGGDYQLAIETAQNNLAKAQTNYDDAVWQYEHQLKSDEATLAQTKASLESGFDDYTYTTAISDAQVTLAKRKQELADAEATAAAPYDSYNSDRQMEDAVQTLADREAALAEAQANTGAFDDYSYQKAITQAQATLTKRQAELKEAETSANAPFDATTANRQLADAQVTLATRQKELQEAENNALYPFNETDYNRKIIDAQNSLNDKIASNASAGQIATAQNTLDRLYEDEATARANAQTEANTKLETARKNLDTAQLAVTRLQEDIASQKSTAGDDVNSKLKTAQDNASDAAAALADAQRSLEKARSDYAEQSASAITTAQKNINSAKLAITRLEQDVTRSITTAEKDARDKLATAKQNVTDAERALTKAQENYTKAKKDYSTSSQKTQADYQLKLDSLEHEKEGSNSVANAASAIKDAELALTEAETKLEKVRIYAPIDGQILNISKKVGEKVTASNAGGQMMFGTAGSSNNFLTICDLSEIYLSANITEGDIIGVETGQTVNVTVDAIEGSTFTGVVQTVSSLPTTDSSGITTYAVTVLLDKSAVAIKDGMAALLTFVRLSHPDVLMIPNKSVFIEEGKQYVNVSVNGGYEKREVSCGLTNGTETEVLSGLEEGESVAVGAIK